MEPHEPINGTTLARARMLRKLSQRELAKRVIARLFHAGLDAPGFDALRMAVVRLELSRPARIAPPVAAVLELDLDAGDLRHPIPLGLPAHLPRRR